MTGKDVTRESLKGLLIFFSFSFSDVGLWRSDLPNSLVKIQGSNVSLTICIFNAKSFSHNTGCNQNNNKAASTLRRRNLKTQLYFSG